MALLRDAGDRLDASRFQSGLEARDLEIPIRRGYLAFVAAAESGELAQLWEQRSGKLPGEALAVAVERLHDLFR